MRLPRLLTAAVSLMLFALTPCSTHSASFQGLGDLPGGEHLSVALDVSGNGMTVVGYSASGAKHEAFRWTQAEGILSLGDPPGDPPASSAAQGVSFDGSAVAGTVRMAPAGHSTWAPTGSLIYDRWGHTATRLPDGCVLVAGGRGSSGRVRPAELYDSATGTWSLTGSLNEERLLHTATLLADGRVLVTGGETGGHQQVSSCELYDPTTGTWAVTGSMSWPRWRHTATQLSDGRVLVAGGAYVDWSDLENPKTIVLSSAELYDPATGIWQETGTLISTRTDHTATRLPDGKVLVAGGSGGGTLVSAATSAEVYDPTTGGWSLTGALQAGHSSHAASVVLTGEVLIAGGGSPPELYDPSQRRWRSIGHPNAPLSGRTATVLESGEVLVVDGALSSLYDPLDAGWTPSAFLDSWRFYFSATLLSDGRVLVAGGSSDGFLGGGPGLSSAELYDPTSMKRSDDRLLRWTPATGSVNLGYPPDSSPARGAAAGVSGDGTFVAVNGYSEEANFHAYLWSESVGYVGIAGDLPGGVDLSRISGISADGLVVAGTSHRDAGLEAYRWSAATDVATGLGDLSGGVYRSCASQVSADGSVVVGQSSSASGSEAFRWSELTGMAGLGDLPGGTFDSHAYDTSADGGVVVGYGATDAGREAFVWDRFHGMRRLANVLEDVGGLDLAGWTLTEAVAVADDGRTIVGNGRNPAGDAEAWIANVTTLDVLPLTLPTVRGCAGATVLVPVTVQGFRAIGSLQLTIEWDPAVAAYDGVEQFGLPDLGAENFGTPEAGKLTFSWEDVSLEGTTLPDDSTLFAVRLALIGPRGATCRVFVGDGPTAAEATTADYQLLEVIATDGGIEILADLAISGGVAYYQGARPISDVSLVLTGDDNQSVASDVAGRYELTVLGCGSYHVRAEKLTHTPPNEGVTAADVLKLRRHVLGLELLTPPFELLASDANASRTITSMDIRLIRQLILDLRGNLPAGLWRFVDADHVFPDPAAPWNAPASRDYPDLRVDVSGQDYIGIKIGDANGSWAPPPGFLALRPALRTMAPALGTVQPVWLKVASGLVQVGKEVELAIRADAVADLTTLQFTVTWDPACLRFRSVTRQGLRGLGADNYGTHRQQEGRLTFAWDDPQAQGVKLAQGEGVFSLRFEAIGRVGELTIVRLAGTPTVIEATVGGVVIPTEWRAGAVLLTSSEKPPKLQCHAVGREHLRLAVEGPAGAVCVVEFSTDLMHWAPAPAVAPLRLADEAITVELPAGVTTAGFYRLSFVDAGWR